MAWWRVSLPRAFPPRNKSPAQDTPSGNASMTGNASTLLEAFQAQISVNERGEAVGFAQKSGARWASYQGRGPVTKGVVACDPAGSSTQNKHSAQKMRAENASKMLEACQSQFSVHARDEPARSAQKRGVTGGS